MSLVLHPKILIKSINCLSSWCSIQNPFFVFKIKNWVNACTEWLAVCVKTDLLSGSSSSAQNKRLGALNKFKSKSRSVLLATDVASRGLDIPHVDCVINYDIPTHSKVRRFLKKGNGSLVFFLFWLDLFGPCVCWQDYIHRVGRTARAGRSGKSITFVTQLVSRLTLSILIITLSIKIINQFAKCHKVKTVVF